MANYARSSFFTGSPQVGPTTKWLCGLLAGVSLLAAVVERRFGISSQWLLFDTQAVLHGDLWRLLSYAFIKRNPLSLLISVVVLWLFGRTCEGAWGSRDYLRFFLASSIGGAALAIPISLLVNLLPLFEDMGVFEGPDAAIDAMMVALALHAPDAKILFGFVLPMPAKNIVYVLLGFDVFFGLMTGASTISITLGGMLMGYLLVTGHWRPSLLLAQVRLWRLRKRRRDGLYVVPPRGKRDLN
jgi:membrane associated rhomboid family serine protease